MRILLIGLVVSATLLVALIEAAPPELCKEVEENEPKCEETDYEKYMKCIEERNDRRKKRQAVCPFAQQQQQLGVLPNYVQHVGPYQNAPQVSCEEHNLCVFGCQQNASCAAICPQPTVPCVNGVSQTPVAVPPCPVEYTNCIGNCNSNVNCQAGCQHYCTPEYRTVVIQGGDQDNRVDTPMTGGRNITTVIKLNNYINNTNVVNVPTNVNATHVNNIHIYTNTSKTGGKYGMGYTPKGDCCISVRPKSCHPSSQGYRCHHKRHKTCGHQCKSKIIHAVPRKRCHGGGCQERVAYVPQPKPTCVHRRQWPYVVCGQSQESFCEGCYDHYGYGYDNYYGGQGPECQGCFDDGFEYGPMYRRGPVLRPHYYHEPPCFITGTCYDGYDVDCGYGCYGHEYIDPAWGYGPQRPHRPPPHHVPHDRDYFDEEDYVVVDDEGVFRDKVNETEINEDDFDVPVHKCKVVNEDNSITIRNCTVDDINNNPYATRPMGKYPHYSEDNDDRLIRQRGYDYDPYYYHYSHHSPRRGHAHHQRRGHPNNPRDKAPPEIPLDDDEITSGDLESDTGFFSYDD